MVYIKGRSGKINRSTYNRGYCEVEIESYDHDNTLIFLRKDFTDLNNTKAFQKYDLEFITANNVNNNYTASLTANINENGEYRVILFGLTNPTYKDTIEVTIGGKTLPKQSMWTIDEFVRSFDMGTIFLTEGQNTITINGMGRTSFAILSLKKIRRFYGNTDNIGELKIQDVEFTRNGITNLDTFKLSILNDKKFLDPGATDYHKSGLVFEYGDSINIKLGETRKTINHSFGGYITVPELSENELTIKLSGLDRLMDLNDHNNLFKEICVGGAITSTTGLSYTTNSLYNAMIYLVESPELYMKTMNLSTLLKESLPTKYGVTIDLGIGKNYNNLQLGNMIKSVVSDPQKGNVLQLKNDPRANRDQYCIIFDSNKRLLYNTPPNIKDTGIIYIEYGLGAETSTRVETKRVATTKKLKNGRTQTTYKTVKETVKTGFDKDKPFLCWLEVQYSTTPNGEIKTVNVDFTSKTTSNKVGAIEPVIEYGQWKSGEFDLLSVLNITDPQSAYYLRRLTFKTKTPPENLYDPKQPESEPQYKILLKKVGFKNGTPITPELIKTSGKTQFDLIKEICDKLNLTAVTIPAKERRNDHLSVEKEESVLCPFTIQEGVNLLDISNIKYSAHETLKNSIAKIFKNTNGTYNVTRQVDPYSIGHFGTRTDVEVLNEEPGLYQANYLATIGLDKNTLPNWSYTAKVLGLPDVRIGRLVPCVFRNSYWNEIKTIKSISCHYQSEGAKVYTEIGLDDVDIKISASQNIRNLRKQLLPQIEYSGGAEYEEAVEIIDE